MEETSKYGTLYIGYAQFELLSFSIKHLQVIIFVITSDIMNRWLMTNLQAKTTKRLGIVLPKHILPSDRVVRCIGEFVVIWRILFLFRMAWLSLVWFTHPFCLKRANIVLPALTSAAEFESIIVYSKQVKSLVQHSDRNKTSCKPQSWAAAEEICGSGVQSSFTYSVHYWTR